MTVEAVLRYPPTMLARTPKSMLPEDQPAGTNARTVVGVNFCILLLLALSVVVLYLFPFHR